METANLFFDKKDLKKCGENVIIGKTVRIRYPELVELGDNVIIDDFIYISTALKIGSSVHIASGCHLIGGKSCSVRIDSFSTLAPNVVLAAGSDDYVGGIGSPIVPDEVRGKPVLGNIWIKNYCIVGANSVILPNVTINEGGCVGALSLVKNSIPAWELHAGIPATLIKKRDKETILENAKKYL